MRLCLYESGSQAMACLTVAAVVVAPLLWRYYSPWEAALLSGGLLGMMGLVYLWWQSFDESRACQNYVCMMRLGCLIALGFFLYSVGI